MYLCSPSIGDIKFQWQEIKKAEILLFLVQRNSLWSYSAWSRCTVFDPGSWFGCTVSDPLTPGLDAQYLILWFLVRMLSMWSPGSWSRCTVSDPLDPGLDAQSLIHWFLVQMHSIWHPVLDPDAQCMFPWILFWIFSLWSPGSRSGYTVSDPQVSGPDAQSLIPPSKGIYRPKLSPPDPNILGY